MPSGPSLFDDEDAPAGLTTPSGGTPPASTTRSSTTRSGTTPASTTPPSEARSRGPNYLFRRAVAIGGVVAVIATASIVIGQMIGTGADDTESGAISSEWNRIVLVDERTGSVVVDDADGEELARIESGLRTPTASAVVDSTLVVAAADAIAVIDVADETVDEFDLGADAIVRPAGSALTMIAPGPDGARGLLVHGPTGDVIDTDTLAPVVGARYEFADARASSSGRQVLVTDSGNFQSVLFSFDNDEPAFYPGLALAVDADLVVTTQNVGANATVNVFDHAGESLAIGTTPSVRTAMITGGAIVLVTVDGAIVTMSPSTGDTADRAELDIGAIGTGDVTPSGDRLVVTGATGTAVIGDDGDVVATSTGQRPAGAARPPTGSTCLALTLLDDTADQRITVISLADGAVQTEAEAEASGPVLTDASGCTVAATTAGGFDVVGPNGVERFENGDILLALSPDGTTVVAERDGRVVLLDAASGDEASGDPVDLGPRGRSVSFTRS